MRILYYCWNENSSYDIMDAFSKLKIEYKKIDVACQDYDEDSGLEEVFLHELEIADYDAIFTFDYFPVISQIVPPKRKQVYRLGV